MPRSTMPPNENGMRAAAGRIQAGAKGTGNLAEWRGWQTPTLQADVAN